jgi:hypothetical protein
MDHSDMSHEDMDMGNGQPKCSMNVRPLIPPFPPPRPKPPHRTHPLTNLSSLDAIHLVHPKPLHRLPQLAHNRPRLAPPLPPRHRRPLRRLRARERTSPEIRGEALGQDTGVWEW